ncbi:PAS domain S-box protein [Candidatus Gracilibacteria bacterium]|nr:PAS domain S-box protein [Candidatus Gracilibacteria bacterium]
MNIKNKFILFFSVILLSFVGALSYLLSGTENMINKSLTSDFIQIAASTAKEVDVYLLERILSLETLSHNEGMKAVISGADDTGKKVDSLTHSEDKYFNTLSGQTTEIKNTTSLEQRGSTGSLDNTTPIIRRNIPRNLISSGGVNTLKKTDIIIEDEHLQEVLEDFIKINNAFHSVEIISASGRTIAYIVENEMKGEQEEEGEKIVKKIITERLGRDRTEKTLFQQASTGNKSYYIQDVVKEDDGSYTIDIAVPIMLMQGDKKVFIGVIFGDLNLKHIWEITDSIKIGDTGEVMIYNASGATIADRYKEKILTYPKIVVPSIQALMCGESGHTVEISEMGTETITAYMPLPGIEEYKGLGWGLQVTQDTSEAFDSLNTFKFYSFFLMGALILLVLFFVYLIQKGISNPIVRLARVANEIAGGNYLIDMSETEKDSQSQDEIGTLAKTFQIMLINLRTNISLMEQYKHAIDESSLVSKTDLRGIITYANKQFCDKAQYTESELIGKPHSIVRHPDMPKEAFKDLWDTISAKKIWKGIVKNRAKDGSEYWVAATITPLLDIQGNIFEYMSVRTDITELQNTKLQLTESFKKLQENTEALLEGGIIENSVWLK